jgi:hypothetical protein
MSPNQASNFMNAKSEIRIPKAEVRFTFEPVNVSERLQTCGSSKTVSGGCRAYLATNLGPSEVQ